MHNMDKDILEYLKSQNVCVVAVEMPDGSPHGATVHFAHAEDPFTLLFLTSSTYRKSEALKAKESVRATVVIGSNEGDMKTFQLDGVASLLPKGDALEETYFMKFPEKREKYEGSHDIFFTFTPTWWRFSDWTQPSGKAIRTSE